MRSPAIRGRSVAWVVSDVAATALLTIGTMLVLARFVTPSDFGISAFVVGTVLLINLYVEGLFHDALIQNPVVDDRTFDQALSLVLLIAALVVLVASVAALALRGGPYGQFAALFWAASLSLLFSGPLGVANAKLRRRMEYQDVARASVIGKVAGCTIAIALVYAEYGAWGVVAQYPAGAAVQAATLYGLAGWRPHLGLSFGALRPILGFALPYAVMHSLVAARIQGFFILVAALMGLSAAGFVNVAFRITNTPQIALATTLNNLCFPLLARHQQSRTELEDAFVLVTKVIAISTVPLFLGLALVGGDLVPLVLGPGWDSTIDLIRLMSIASAISFTRMSCSLLLRARGHVRFSFWNAALQLTTTLGLLAVLRPADPHVAVLFWVVPVALQLPSSWLVLYRVEGFGLRLHLKGLSSALVGAVGLALVVTLCQVWASSWAPVGRLALCVAAGGIVFVLSVLAVDRDVRTFVGTRLRGLASG